jgi:hypothetical protein
MYTLTITGGSDDLIEIGGDLEAEFTANDDFDARENTGGFVAVNDGTLLKVLYDKSGIWRVTLIARGESDFSKVEGDVESDKFDVVTLTSKERFRWVVQGVDYSTSR